MGTSPKFLSTEKKNRQKGRVPLPEQVFNHIEFPSLYFIQLVEKPHFFPVDEAGAFFFWFLIGRFHNG